MLNINNKPNTYKEALNSINRNNWLKAIEIEIKELERQNTWDITNLPYNRTALKGKWVYKYKMVI